MKRDWLWWLRSVLLLLAAVHVLFVIGVSLRRMVHPFELEWMEGAMVDHVERVLQGKKLYVEPTVEFVPFIYGPLYFWASALVAKVVGLSFLPLRIVSVVSTIVSFYLIYAIVEQETEDHTAGIVAAGGFAATYLKSAQFLDIGRVDALSLALSLGAIHVLRNRARHGFIVCSVLLSLAFLAKQSSFVLVLALIVHQLWVHRRRAIPFAILSLVLTLGVATLLDWMHAGWFRYYTWELPRAHPIVQHSLWGFWTDDLFPAIAIMGAFAAFYFIGSNPKRDGARLFHFLSAGGMIASAWSGRLHDGGWPNVLIPAFAGFAVLFGLGLGEAFRASDVPRVRAVAIAAAGLQLAALLYNPKHVLPKKNDAQLGWELIARLKAVKGDVFVPNHSWYARMAGKSTHAHRMAIDDVFRGDPYGAGPQLAMDIKEALQKKRWGGLFMDDEFFERELLPTYQPAAPPFTSKDGFFPVTGIHVRPRLAYVPLP
jgi:4-amino-4-deoxy-L-arabinose transferase-like glycosyltransferase